MKRKAIRLNLILMLLLVIAACNTNQNSGDIQNDIDEIGKEWVPDKREGVSEVVVSSVQNSYTIKGEVDNAGHKAAVIGYFSDRQLDFVDSLLVLPDTTTDHWGLIAMGYGNLRGQPRHAAELLTQAIMGTPVRIMKREGSWLYIQTPDSYLGWITGSTLSVLSTEEMNAWRNASRVISLVNYSLVYADEKETGVVCDIPLGSIIEKTSEKTSHYQVDLPDGRSGFVRRSEYVMFDEWLGNTQASVASLEAYGRGLMGVPYLWGGTTAFGLDCSGFMKTIFFVNGMILARDASLQVRHGEEVESSISDYSRLEPGDMIFFGNQTSRRVGHVGLYLGDGEVMHESGRVRIDNLDRSRDNFSNYLATTYLSARRVLGLQSQPGLMAVKDHPWYVNN